MPSTRILVIDDNAALRDEVANVLQVNGFEVDTAGDGRSALSLVEARRPDLVICDLTMPDLDGYAILRAIRGNPATETLPFLVLSGREDRADIRQGMELGADDYITKPFRLEELLRGVRAALDKHARFVRRTEAQLEHLREHVALALPHEIRTPLSAIVGYAEMLTDADAQAAPGDVAGLARRIIGASHRLNRMSENALLYVQLELLGGEGVGARAGEAATATTLAGVVEAQARLKAGAYRRESDLRIEGSAVGVAVGPTYVAKVVDELVDNACRFSEAGSAIVLEIAHEDAWGVLRVRDAGCGMSDEQIAAVGGFVQFERSIREQQGLGLGLAIARRIAIVWGGGLEIESELGRGTTVTVRLPVAVG